METCDVLIVGGGPAGSSCAWRLVTAGLNVVVIDKSTFPRDKVCAGWITPAVLQDLAIDLDDYRQGRICQPIRAVRTGAMSGPYLHHQYNDTVSYGIRRCEFDDYLLKRSGAKLRLGEPLKKLKRQNHHWIINDNIKAKMLVGAGGHFCPVARSLGARVGKGEQSVAAQEIEFEMNDLQVSACTVEADTPELFFYPDLSGYAWLFRKGRYLNVGVGRDMGEKISQSALQFLEFCERQGKIPKDLNVKMKGHAYLLYDYAVRKLFDDNVLLIGDAAGLAYTESGEGIRPAVESGLIAAQVIHDARGNYQQSHLQAYHAHLIQRFGKRQPQHHGWLPGQLKRTLAKQLLSNRFLSRHILLNRFFLHKKDPPIILNKVS